MNFNDHLKLKNVDMEGIPNLLVAFDKNTANYVSISNFDDFVKLVGENNINNVKIY